MKITVSSAYVKFSSKKKGVGEEAQKRQRGTEVPLILWAWQLVIVYQVQLGCYPESRMPLSGTYSS